MNTEHEPKSRHFYPMATILHMHTEYEIQYKDSVWLAWMVGNKSVWTWAMTKAEAIERIVNKIEIYKNFARNGEL